MATQRPEGTGTGPTTVDFPQGGVLCPSSPALTAWRCSKPAYSPWESDRSPHSGQGLRPLAAVRSLSRERSWRQVDKTRFITAWAIRRRFKLALNQGNCPRKA